MTAYLHIVRIEIRRNLGLWLLLPMMGIVFYPPLGALLTDAALWIDLSVSIKNSAVFLGPVIGALAAWMAGRNKRRGIEELLSTTPRPAPARDISLALGTVFWGVAAYVVAALVLGIATTLRATWGFPHLLVLLAGLLSIGAAGALGYAVGVFARSRFIPPLVAVALFLAQQVPTGYDSGVRYLSPLDWNSYSVFYGVQPDVGLLQVLWFGGLAAMALAAVAFRHYRVAMSQGALLAATAVMTAGIVPLLLVDTEAARSELTPVSYEPVCMEQSMTVCVHPAFEAVLPEVAGIAERLSAPLAGVPGVPTRAEQRARDGLPQGVIHDGTFVYKMNIMTSRSNNFLSSSREARLGVVARDMARGLVVEKGYPRALPVPEAQAVVGSWLLKQAGFPDEYKVMPRFERNITREFQVWLTFGDEEAEAAVERFDALDPAVRRAWLEDNFAALRAGELTLEDLP